MCIPNMVAPTRRVHRGYGISPDALDLALRHIVDRREKVLAVPGEVAGLPDRKPNRARDYPQHFSKMAEDSDRPLAQFEKRCLCV